MDIGFSSKRTRELYTDERGAEAFPEEVVSAFFRGVASVRGAKDENDLSALWSHRLERLDGTEGPYLLHLSGQWRLHLTFDVVNADVKSAVLGKIRSCDGDGR